MMDRMSGRSRGFAFVTMATPEAAATATQALAVARARGPDDRAALGLACCTGREGPCRCSVPFT